MDFVLSGLDVSGARRYEGRYDSDETKGRLNVDSMKSMWDTNHMNYELDKETKSYYEIQYTSIWEPDVWYPSTAVNRQFKTYSEACYNLRKLVEAEQKATQKCICEYRVVEHVVTTTTEVLKSCPINKSV